MSRKNKSGHRWGKAIDRIAKKGGVRAAARYARAAARAYQRANSVRSVANLSKLARLGGSVSRGAIGAHAELWKAMYDSMFQQIILATGTWECGGPFGTPDSGSTGSTTCGGTDRHPPDWTPTPIGIQTRHVVYHRYKNNVAGTQWTDDEVMGKWKKYDGAVGPFQHIQIPNGALDSPKAPAAPAWAAPNADAPGTTWDVPVPPRYRDVPRTENPQGVSQRSTRGNAVPFYRPAGGGLVRWPPIVVPDRPDWPGVRPWPDDPSIPGVRPKPPPDKPVDKPDNPTQPPIVVARPGTVAAAPGRAEHQKKSVVTKAAWETLNVYGAYTEFRDLVNAIYKALPASRRRWERRARPGHKLTWTEKAAIIYEHYDEIDLARAVLEIAKANIEDAAMAMQAKPYDKLIQQMFPGLGERLVARQLAKQVTQQVGFSLN